MPGAAAATLIPLSVGAKLPGLNAPGTPVSVSYPDPASWRVVTKAGGSQLLRLRLTDVAGWHASIDGKPLALERFGGIMLQARIPPGSHVVELHYWPETFTVGLVCAAAERDGAVVGNGLGSETPACGRREPHHSRMTVDHTTTRRDTDRMGRSPGDFREMIRQCAYASRDGGLDSQGGSACVPSVRLGCWYSLLWWFPLFSASSYRRARRGPRGQRRSRARR